MLDIHEYTNNGKHKTHSEREYHDVGISLVSTNDILDAATTSRVYSANAKYNWNNKGNLPSYKVNNNLHKVSTNHGKAIAN